MSEDHGLTPTGDAGTELTEYEAVALAAMLTNDPNGPTPDLLELVADGTSIDRIASLITETVDRVTRQSAPGFAPIAGSVSTTARRGNGSFDEDDFGLRVTWNAERRFEQWATVRLRLSRDHLPAGASHFAVSYIARLLLSALPSMIDSDDVFSFDGTLDIYLDGPT